MQTVVPRDGTTRQHALGGQVEVGTTQDHRYGTDSRDAVHEALRRLEYPRVEVEEREDDEEGRQVAQEHHDREDEDPPPVCPVARLLPRVFHDILTRYIRAPDDDIDTQEFGRLDGDEAQVDPALCPIGTLPQEELRKEEPHHEERRERWQGIAIEAPRASAQQDSRADTDSEHERMLEDGIQSPDGEALIDLRAQRARYGVERDQDEHKVECPHEAVAREDAAQP